MKNTYDENYKALADAIIVQAGIDYLKVMRVLDLAKGNKIEAKARKEARAELSRIRRFFKYVGGKHMVGKLNRSYRKLRESGNLDRITHLNRTAS